ncbi:MAG: YraN family protein [Planctomycetota bacterium]
MAGRFKPASRVGRRGERVAASYLKRRGFRVLGRNVHVGVGEADLVCLSPDGASIVVVEVKARTASAGSRRPESQVGRAKRRKLRQVAEVVHRRFGARSRSVRGIRVDVVAVELRRWPRRSIVRHHESAVSWS